MRVLDIIGENITDEINVVSKSAMNVNECVIYSDTLPSDGGSSQVRVKPTTEGAFEMVLNVYSLKDGKKDKEVPVTISGIAFVKKSETSSTESTIKKYKVKFNAKKGKVVGAKSKLVTYGKKYGKLPKAKRKGYNFKGWYTKGGTKITKSKKMKYKKNITVYAKWAKNGKIVKCKAVNVRKGAGSKYSVMTWAKKNQMVCIIGKKGNWYKVKVGKKTGYIYPKYVKRI